MIKEHSLLIRKLEILVDMAVLAAAANVATIIYRLYFDPRFHINIGLSFFSSLRTLPFYYLSIVFFITTLIYYLYFDNIYYTQRFFEISTLAKKILVDVVKSSIIVGTITYLISSVEFPLKFFFLYSATSLVFLTSFRIIVKIFLFRVRRKGINTRYIVILGTKEGISAIRDKMLPKHRGWGLIVKNTLNISKQDSLRKFESILKTKVVDDIFVSCDGDDITISPSAKPFLLMAQDFGKSIRIFVNPKSCMDFLNFEVSVLGEYPTLFFSHRNFSDDMFFVKRFADIILGIIGCIITLIFLPFVALAIRLDSDGPIFSKQTRIGNNGHSFTIFKFRTTAENTDSGTRAAGNGKSNTENSPEHTKVGKFLKRFCIDELPQFFNILQGKMSLVGTRPPAPNEVEQYDSWHYKKISFKPGLTGMWRISKNNHMLDFDDIVSMDLEYIDNWSILLDLTIIVKTLRVIILKGINSHKV